MKILKNLLVSVSSLIALSGCVLSPTAQYLEVRKNVISINSDKANQFSVGTVVLGETPGSGLYSVSITPESVVKALETNLANYDLLAEDQNASDYKIDLDMTFSKGGRASVFLTGRGTYLITNIQTNTTRQIIVEETYVAVYKISFGALVAVAIGGQAAANSLNQSQTYAEESVGDSTRTLTKEEKAELKTIGYAPVGVPINAHAAQVKIIRAYEGSIRLNMAKFIEKLQSVELP